MFFETVRVENTSESRTHDPNLLVSKARVAPCKGGRLTIAKLELTTALIGCRLIDHLDNLFTISRFFLWLDSKVTLSWISSNKELKDVHVANRVAEIQTLVISLGIVVNYVPTNDNPADLVPTGCTVSKLKSSNWMHGPAWLATQEYPDQDNEVVVVVQELIAEINPIIPVPPLIDLTRHSTYIKAERVMCRVLQFIESDINPFEVLIRQELRLHCNSIHTYLLNPRIRVTSDANNTVKEINLTLINDTIRTQRRLAHADLPLNAKIPLFLPVKAPLANSRINWVYDSPPSQSHHIAPR